MQANFEKKKLIYWKSSLECKGLKLGEEILGFLEIARLVGVQSSTQTARNSKNSIISKNLKNA